MMRYTTLISHQELFPHLGSSSWAIVDCRFDLLDPAKGEREYLEAHIPGAVYAHLDKDLSAPVTGTNGRHPLPTVEKLTTVFSQWGIGKEVQVVAYDSSGGPFASRLWWSLRYLGHDAVAVLDGGFPIWIQAELPITSGLENRSASLFKPQIRPSMSATISQVMAQIHFTSPRLMDARSPERHSGMEEPHDPVAGYIPGSINHFWGKNLDENGNFLSREILHKQYKDLLGELPPKSLIVYCGSGVTSCHNLLAMTYAGFEGSRLYPGSWSEWCSDPARPVATKDNPTLNLTTGST
jgi:thiosulfate/3-mercaptopyruvate sulfurtransferase